jgi:apolipoprotein N-acyltransferase
MTWVGLALATLVCALLASYPAAALVLAMTVSILALFAYKAPTAPADWQAMSTRFGGVGLDTPSPLAEYAAAQSIQETALASPARVIVFPETVVSIWNPGTDLFWQRAIDILRNQGKTILVGANVFDATSQHYYNSVIVRGATERPDFVQRIPIPIAMWIPFSSKGVPLRLGGPGTVEIAGKRAAILICYENLLVWPVVKSLFERPDIILGIANDYWAKRTTIPQIQHACLESWARLFKVPLLWAQNT